MADWTPVEEVPKIVAGVDAAFRSDKTRPVEWRKEQLRQLWSMLDENETEVLEALFADIGKPRNDAFMAEIGLTKSEILHNLSDMDSWLAPETVSVPEPYQFWQPTIHKQPKGTVLIISTWNFPVFLTLLPLISIISAGNTAIIKPSEIAPHVATLLSKLIPKYLDAESFPVVLGDAAIVTSLLTHKFGHIIYTGSPGVAKLVMAAAAKTLTPVTLELGGKAPVVVSDKAKIELAAKRVAWGKFLNAGQVCMAVDYAIVQENVFDSFLEALKKEIEKVYGADANKKMSRIINANHFNRIESILKKTAGIVYGGKRDPETLYFEPTIVTGISETDSVLQSELFGPVLPILTYKTLPDVRSIMTKIDENPLAIYVMSEDCTESDWLREFTTTGGMCVNDIMGQAIIPGLPFGGIGNSGMGNFHGKAGIDTFSHRKSVATVSTDPAFEAMLEFRYITGDLDEKYKLQKQMEGKLI